MNITLKADFDSALRFTKLLMNQRRLKVIHKISIDKKIEKDGLDFLNINLEIEGYYL